MFPYVQSYFIIGLTKPLPAFDLNLDTVFAVAIKMCDKSVVGKSSPFIIIFGKMNSKRELSNYRVIGFGSFTWYISVR